MIRDTLQFELPESEDTRAVSPVIGVILMVAITIILAAVIGAFVLGFSTDTETPPNTAWDSSQEPVSVTDADDLENVTFTIETTDRAIDAGDLAVTFPDTTDADRTDVDSDLGTLRAGDSITVASDLDGEEIAGTAGIEDIEEGDRIRIVWEGDDTSTTLTTHTVN